MKAFNVSLLLEIKNTSKAVQDMSLKDIEDYLINHIDWTCYLGIITVTSVTDTGENASQFTSKDEEIQLLRNQITELQRQNKQLAQSMLEDDNGHD